MKKSRTKLRDRSLPSYSRGEEIFNMASHAAAAVFAVTALTLCVAFAAANRNVWGIVSGSVYGVTMISLYAMSGIYHGLTHELTKKVFQIIDHCAVFLLIAGTYTPITLVSLRESSPFWGWTVFGIVWVAAIVGIVLNSIDLRKYRVFSIICYIATGWSLLIALPAVLKALPASAFWLIFSGGIAYTVGAVLYAMGKSRKFMHCIFHLLVTAGSVLQFIAIAKYII